MSPLALSVDWGWLGPIIGIWIFVAFGFAALWSLIVGRYERAARRDAHRRPLAPLVELDLVRARRRRRQRGAA